MLARLYPPETDNLCRGRPTLAPTHPPGPLRAPRERLASCLYVLARIRRSRDTPASDAPEFCGYALRRVRMAFPILLKVGTAVLCRECLLRSRHRGDGTFSLGMIAEYMDSLLSMRQLLPKSLLGGRTVARCLLEAEEAAFVPTGSAATSMIRSRGVRISSRDWQTSTISLWCPVETEPDHLPRTAWGSRMSTRHSNLDRSPRRSLRRWRWIAR